MALTRTETRGLKVSLADTLTHSLSHRNNNYLNKGVDVANAINRKQRSGGADLIIIEALQKGDDDGAPKEFWAILGGKPATIPETGGDDAQTEKMWNELDKLYR